MKNILLIPLILIIICFELIGKVNANNSVLSDNSHVEHNNVENVFSDNPAHLIQKAERLKSSNPDSAMSLYNRAWAILSQVNDENKKAELAIKILLGKAAIELLKGNVSIAWEQDSIALKMADENGLLKLKAHALMTKGAILMQQSNFDAARSVSLEALFLAKSVSDYKTSGKVLTNLGTLAYITGNSHEADSFFKLPLQLGIQHRDAELMAASYLNLGLLDFYRSRYNQAEIQMKKALGIYKALEGIDGIALCYQNLANLKLQLGEIAESIEFQHLNLKYLEDIGDLPGMSRAFQNLGENYAQLGNYEKSLDYYIKSLDIKHSLNDQKGMAATMNSMGNLHLQLENYNIALSYYRKSLNINTLIGFLHGKADCHSSLGTIYLAIRKPDTALYHIALAEKYYNSNGYISNASDCLMQMGEAFMQKSEFKLAEEKFIQVLQLKQDIGDVSGLMNVWNIFSRFNLNRALMSNENPAHKEKLLKSAASMALDSYKQAIIEESLPAKQISATLLAQIYHELNDYKKGLDFALKSIIISDSLKKIQRAQELANAEISWNVLNKEAEVLRLQSESKFQQQVINKKNSQVKLYKLIFSIALATLLFIVLAVFFFIRSRIRKKELERQKHLLEITRLKMQNINNRISPHFFFNLLSGFQNENGMSEALQNKLKQTALLLRKSLENAERHTIPLIEELDIVKTYIGLNEHRLGNSFHYNLELDPNINKNSLIPVMIIQIPVENAIKHGLMPSDKTKELHIKITGMPDYISIKIADNGIGRSNSSHITSGTGTGLKILIQTIKLLNDNNLKKILFNIHDNKPRGTEVEILIPNVFNYSI